ncbi:MAG: antibiotic biosynthesis monooxygenase [Planctomycetes bacterium]|nr:antibiotic biosynthesis monooxygenase [Planctomycetota bacterium]
MKNVVFLRPFKVPADREKEFLAAWTAFVTHASKHDGFVKAEVLRSLDDDSPWSHVTQIEVASYAKLTEALADPELLRLRNAVPYGQRAGTFEPVEF